MIVWRGAKPKIVICIYILYLKLFVRTIEWLCCAYNKIYHMLWIHDMPHLSAYINTEV